MQRQQAKSSSKKALARATPAASKRKPLKKTTKRTITTKKASTTKTALATLNTIQLAPITTTIKTTVKKATTPFQRQTLRRFASMPPSGQILELPALSPTMEVGGLTQWHATIGSIIRPGDLIADIQTDKAVVPFESQDEYYLAAILVQGGTENIAVGTPLGITVEEEADIAAAQAYAATLMDKTAAAAPPAAAEVKAAPKVAEPKSTTAPAPTKGGAAGTYTHRKLPPATEAMVHVLNIDPTSIKPTGPRGHLTKSDVILAIEAGTVAYLPEKPKKEVAAATAAPAAKKATTTPAAPAPAQEQGGRRRRPRTFTDIPITEATQKSNKDLVNAGIPANYETGTVSLKKINSMINTYAKECDINAALVSIIAKSINSSLNNATKDADLMVIDRATGQKTLLSRQVATKIGSVFKKTRENAQIDAISASYNINLYTGLPTDTANSIERVPTGAAMAVTVGTPFNQVSMVGDVLAIDRVVQISIATDNNVVHEQAAASIIKSVKGYTNDPITMLL